MNHFFYFLLAKFQTSKTSNFSHIFCDLTSFPKVGSIIYFSGTGKMGENGQRFIRVAKPYWDQTVGSERAASAARTSGSLSTGSPVGSLELTFLKGLMYSQATVTTHDIG